jgi:23S rRNA (guanosine2251-2'-O)-methyltransferase
VHAVHRDRALWLAGDGQGTGLGGFEETGQHRRRQGGQAGAAETVPYITVTNLARTMRDLKERGIWLIGTSDDADKGLYEGDFTGPTALVMGSEGEGMRRLTRETCDILVSIPMFGSVESLNVSVASGVCLYEARRQRLAREPH